MQGRELCLQSFQGSIWACKWLIWRFKKSAQKNEGNLTGNEQQNTEREGIKELD